MISDKKDRRTTRRKVVSSSSNGSRFDFRSRGEVQARERAGGRNRTIDMNWLRSLGYEGIGHAELDRHRHLRSDVIRVGIHRQHIIVELPWIRGVQDITRTRVLRINEVELSAVGTRWVSIEAGEARVRQVAGDRGK